MSEEARRDPLIVVYINVVDENDEGVTRRIDNASPSTLARDGSDRNPRGIDQEITAILRPECVAKVGSGKELQKCELVQQTQSLL